MRLSLFHGSVLERALDGRELPFLPGGPAEVRATVAELVAEGLIERRETASGYDLTAKGVEVCREMWPENPKDFERFDPNYEPPDPMNGVEFPFAKNH